MHGAWPKQAVMITLAVCLTLGQCGCLAAAAGVGGYAGYKVADSRSKAADKDLEGKKLQAYNQYKVEMEKVNLEREKAGLEARPILTFAEWEAEHRAPAPATAKEPAGGASLKQAAPRE